MVSKRPVFYRREEPAGRPVVAWINGLGDPEHAADGARERGEDVCE